MSIPTIPPPANIDPELARWLSQLQINIAGALEAAEAETVTANKLLADAKLQIVAIKLFVGMP
jgi:hypothetical protein